MKGKVTKLCDIASINVPEEFSQDSVDTQQVERELQSLSFRYADKITAETVKKGDIVYCAADNKSYPDGRSILLYTALNIPGAEEAEAAVTDKKIGDSLTVTLNGKQVQLTVERIIRLVPAEVNDKLIASIGIENVLTVEDYREYITAKMLADAQMESRKMAMHDIMLQMIENSEFEYDASDVDAYLAGQLDMIEADCKSSGMEMPTQEELREGVLEQLKQAWLAEEICRINNIEIDREAVEADADQMIEMMNIMGEPVPEREEMIEESMRNAYVMRLFEYVDKLLTEKTGR